MSRLDELKAEVRYWKKRVEDAYLRESIEMRLAELCDRKEGA